MTMLECHVEAQRIDSHKSRATCKNAALVLDTEMRARADTFNPAELLLAAIAACMLKGTERVTPALGFRLRGCEMQVRGVRSENPPKTTSIEDKLIVDSDANDHRLELLRTNVCKYGTVFNTVAPGTSLSRSISRFSNAADRHQDA